MKRSLAGKQTFTHLFGRPKGMALKKPPPTLVNNWLKVFYCFVVVCVFFVFVCLLLLFCSVYLCLLVCLFVSFLPDFASLQGCPACGTRRFEHCNVEGPMTAGKP